MYIKYFLVFVEITFVDFFIFKIYALSTYSYTCLKKIVKNILIIINNHKTQGKWRIHSGNTIAEHKTQSEWKIQLTMAINFISSEYSDESRTMHAKSNNVEIMMGNKTNENIEEFFKSFLQRYQEGLEESMRGSEIILDSVDALYYDLNKIILSRGGSYIDSLEWLKNKK